MFTESVNIIRIQGHGVSCTIQRTPEPRREVRWLVTTALMLDMDKRSIRERQAFYPRATIGAL